MEFHDDILVWGGFGQYQGSDGAMTGSDPSCKFTNTALLAVYERVFTQNWKQPSSTNSIPIPHFPFTSLSTPILNTIQHSHLNCYLLDPLILQHQQITIHDWHYYVYRIWKYIYIHIYIFQYIYNIYFSVFYFKIIFIPVLIVLYKMSSSVLDEQFAEADSPQCLKEAAEQVLREAGESRVTEESHSAEIPGG